MATSAASRRSEPLPRTRGGRGARSDGDDAQTKSAIVPLQVKQVDAEARTFEGLAATWDLDLGGDVIKKGAFRRTLADWRRSKRNVLLLDSHDWFSVRNAVGRMIDAKETDEGLLTRWRVVPGSDGDEILARLRPDADGVAFIDSLSIGYLPVRWEMNDEPEEGEPLRVLKEVELREVSLVLFPMNPQARVDSDSVKEMARSVRTLIDRAPPSRRPRLWRALERSLKQEDDDLAERLRDLSTRVNRLATECTEIAEEMDEPEMREIAQKLGGVARAIDDVADGRDEEDEGEEDGEKPARKPKSEDPPPDAHPAPSDAPARKPAEKRRGEPPAEDEDDDGPDLTLYDQLRLRRLESLTH